MLHVTASLRRIFPAIALSAGLVMAGCTATVQPPSPAPSPASAAITGSQSAAEPNRPSASPIEQPPAPPAASPQVAVNIPPKVVARPPLPARLVIPAIQVDAPVEQVGQTPEGAMDVPKEWNDVGWYKLGFRPGESGNAVISGHLDSTTDRAVFWDLHKLTVGDKLPAAQGPSPR